MEPRKPYSLASVLYNHNPFYLISTCFVLYAIKRVFRPMEVPYIDPWMLMAAMGGLTVFMAITAWVIVRFGKIWEDARSLMLVLVIMFLAMSVSFDELLNLRGSGAYWLLGLGFLVSILITECVVGLLQIPFPWLFRLPFYLMLGLFCGFPVLVSNEVQSLSEFATRCRIALFPSIAAIITLTLLPAVRRGPGFINDCVTPCPWKWPLLPWALFGFLWLAVCGRSYYLSISFDTSWGHVDEMFTSFGAYALIPFLLSVCVVLLEIAFVRGSRRFQNGVVLIGSAVLVACSLPYGMGDPIYESFLRIVVRSVGSPIFITLFGVFLFGSYAWWRGVRMAELVVLGSLAGLSVVGWRTMSVETLTTPHVVPIGMIFGLLLITGLSRRDAFRTYLGLTAVSAAISVLLWNHEMVVFRRIVPIHFQLLATIAVGALFRGKVATFLHRAGALLVPVVITVTTRSLFNLKMPGLICATYFVSVAFLCLAYAWFRSENDYKLMGGATLVAGAIRLVMFGFVWLREVFGVDVVWTVSLGATCFLVGAWITAHKAKLLPRLEKPTGANGGGPMGEQTYKGSS